MWSVVGQCTCTHWECSKGVLWWTRNRIKIMWFVPAMFWQGFVLVFPEKVAQTQIRNNEIKKKISKSKIFRKGRYVYEAALTLACRRWPFYHKGSPKRWKYWATELGIVTKKLRPRWTWLRSYKRYYDSVRLCYRVSSAGCETSSDFISLQEICNAFIGCSYSPSCGANHCRSMFREVASEIRGLILEVVLGHLQTIMRVSAIIYT